MDFVFKTDASHTGKAAIEGVDTIDERSSPRARNRFNQVVEAKMFEGVFLCRKENSEVLK